ncbi:MAG TPA: hypothetical protein DDX39_08995 [Bacteroidales bacterium]|nr:MAG: hypothetical protein A2W98_06200 [Bacteroidetes bacterium GWF2_33_38]OFY68619.1 MAG: hypothetical protein A2265_00730 [Bacteroidetes bacterium RIFOXYA12_FULL_33_9]HBF88764.1 hypothetical protein [Bacteroidales bacterium]
MKYFLIISVTFLSFFANANIDSLFIQLSKAKNDSLKAKLNIEIGTELKYTVPDSASLYFEEALKIAKRIKNKKLEAKSNQNIGACLYYLGSNEESLEYMFKAIKIYKNLNDSLGIAESYNSIGSAYDFMGEYEKGLDYFIKALEIHEKLKNRKGISTCLNNIGMINDNQGNHEKALEYYKKSLAIDIELNDKEGISSCYNNLGVVYRKMRNYDLSIEYYLKSLKIDIAMNDIYGVSYSYNNLGNINLELENYDVALDYYLKSLQIKEEIGNKNGIAAVLGNLASLYTILGDSAYNNRTQQITYFNKAIEYGLRGMKIADEIEAIPWKNDLAYHLQESYKGLGNNAEALYYAEIYIETQELMFNDEKTNALAEMEGKYQNEKKQLEIEKLENHKALQDEIIARKENQILFFTVGFILVLIFSILIFRLFVQKKKANKLLAFQNEEILQKNEEINTQKEEIESQRDLVIQQKELIEEIHKSVTDSITYAKRIQQALLPELATSDKGSKIWGEIDEVFIFYRPKDIVSGDFYWATKIDQWLIISVADCTGHGVPGAFMSMLGISFLNEIIRKKEITQANQVLNHLRKSIIDALQQKGITGEQDDGMDISLVVINMKTFKVSETLKVLSPSESYVTYNAQFAGANNPLYIVKSEKLKVKNEENTKLDELSTFNFQLDEVKGDNMPISIYNRMDDFTNHEFTLETGDMIYLFSDGYADQFGGKNDKKYSYKRFKQLLLTNCQLPMSEQKNVIEAEFDNWKNKNEQIDDVTVLGLKIENKSKKSN